MSGEAHASGEGPVSHRTDFQEFKQRQAPDLMQLCQEIVAENRSSIAVKKDGLAVKNVMRILESVFALSREKGFHAMTLRDLSRASGLSMGALYTYFSSKDELRTLIRRKGVLYAKRILLEQIEPFQAAPDRLAAAIRTHLYLSETLRSWFYFAYMEAGSLPAREKRQSMEDERATERIFRDILEQGEREGTFRCGDVELTAALLKAMLQDWYLKRWKYKRKGVSVEAYAGFVAAFVLRAVQGERDGGG